MCIRDRLGVFGVLDNSARTTIHFAHRLGAGLLAPVLSVLLILLFRQGDARLRRVVIISFALLLAQIALGIANVIFVLPLPVATAHNGVATLLVLSWLTLIAMNKPVKR